MATFLKCQSLCCLVIIIIKFYYLQISKCLLPPPEIYISETPNPYWWYSYRQSTDNVTETKLGQDSQHIFQDTTRSATIICNASYPITWFFHNSEQNGHAFWMITVKMIRTAKILYDTSTYGYVAELGIFGEFNRLTGNYSCRSTTKSTLQNSVYIYWEGRSPPFLLQAGENRTVCAENVVKLPCQVSKPDIKVNLYKERNKNDNQLLNLNRSISYNSKDGFILSYLQNILGTYKCTVDNRGDIIKTISKREQAEEINPTEDIVRIKVEKCNTTKTIDLKSNATLTYDSVKGELICCSSTNRAPKMFHYYCHHPIMCSFRLDLDSSYLRHYFTRKRSQRGCSKYKIYVHSPGVVRCIGDGIDSTIEYAFPLIVDYGFRRNISHIPIYFNWNEIPGSEMLVIQPPLTYNHYNNPENNIIEPLYESQFTQFDCICSPYYFAEGIIWAIKFKNKTLQYIEPYDLRNNYAYYFYHSDTLYLNVHLDMESVICIAPVWNSSEYVHKAYHLYVNESIGPEIIGENETLRWTLNDTDKELTCQVKGIPSPDIYWSRINDTHSSFTSFHNTSYHDNVTNTFIRSETIKIPRVTYQTQGIYECTTYNYGGQATKTVEIIIEEPISWKIQKAIIVGSILVLLLIIGIIILIWRMRFEKKRVEQIAAITYQDTITNSEATLRRPHGSLTSNNSNETYGQINNSSVNDHHHHRQFTNEEEEQVNDQRHHHQQQQQQQSHFHHNNGTTTNNLSLID